jgi:hypothetical protein
MGRLGQAVGCLAVICALTGGAVIVGMSFGESAEEDFAVAAPLPSPTPAIGQKLTRAEQNGLGAVAASLDSPHVRVHEPVWESREMRTVRLPAVLTNTGEQPAVVRAQLIVYGEEVALYTGMLDSGNPVKPGSSVVQDVTVESVRDLADLRIELRSVPDQV